MFIIGKATQKEIEEMTKMGFEVEDVDVHHFDLALGADINQDNEEDYEPDRYDPDKLVAIFLDFDIVQECRNIHTEEI